MGKWLLGVIGIIFAMTVISCADYPQGPFHPRDGDDDDSTEQTDPDTTGGNNGGTNPSDTTVCFTRDVLPILISNCTMAECHDADRPEEGIDLTSYASIVSGRKRIVIAGNPSASELYRSLVEDEADERMPPPPRSLSSDQIRLIERWIREGAKNRDCSGESSACDTVNVTYTTVIEPMMKASCVGCHTGYTGSGGVDLSTRSSVEALARSGQLLGTMSWASGYKRMPPSGPKMNDCSIAQVRQWVAGGLR